MVRASFMPAPRQADRQARIPTRETQMSTPTEPAGAIPAVPTPADAVAAGQIPAQIPAAPAAPAPQPAQPAVPAAPGGQQSQGVEPTDWEAEAAKWKALARQHENRSLGALGFKSKQEIDDLRAAAQKHQEYEDAQKSELQRATEQAQTYQQQLETERANSARLMAAATHGIPPELITSIAGTSPEDIDKNAAALAAYLESRSAAAQPAAVQRPVESLTPGAAPGSQQAPASADQWIRQMAGRRTS